MHERDAGMPSVTALVFAARGGDNAAWAALIERFQPLVLAVARRYHLRAADVEDISQTVWLKLIENIDRLREPEALPGWIVTTTANVRLHAAKHSSRFVAVDPLVSVDADGHASRLMEVVSDHDGLDANLLREEDRSAIRRGLDQLKESERDLLLLLVADPPETYLQISQDLGIPVGSIGPTRARCLEKLRNTDAVRAVTHCDEGTIAA